MDAVTQSGLTTESNISLATWYWGKSEVLEMKCVASERARPSKVGFATYDHSRISVEQCGRVVRLCTGLEEKQVSWDN